MPQFLRRGLLILACATALWNLPTCANGQGADAAAKPDAAEAAKPPPDATEAKPSAANAQPAADPLASTDQIQLSFQAANIDMIVQWLAKVTGKSVIKHPKVQCQLTIVSSKKLTARDALTLVYRALALEGFATLESSKSIMIVPEGQEPKLLPELVETAQTQVPDGRQRLIKIFPLKHIQATDLREKVRTVLSDKGTAEISDRSNQIIITDYTDNVRLIGELIKELDVPGADTVIEFFTLKYAEAEELSNLLMLVLNAQSAPPTPGGPAAGPQPPRTSSSSMSRPGVVVSSSDGGPAQPPPPTPQPPGGAPGGAPAAGASQQVRIWPDKVSNRLIVAASKLKLVEVKRLIDILDTEKPQDVSIRVLPLKNVSAEDLVREIGPLYQKLSGKSAKDIIEVTANSRANSLVILSSESNFKTIQKLIASLDTEEAQEKVMQAFPLKNADAEEVAKQLQDLNQDQDTQGRYPYYIYSYSYGQRNTKKINVVADKRRNTVIVQAPPAALENLEKLIKALDEPVTDESLAPKIFRLKFVSASDIEDVLNELFLKRQSLRTYFDPYNPFMQQDGGGDRQGGRLYGKVRITSEAYANAIIVTSNSRENLQAVEDMIKELDVPSQAGETTLRVGLRFAKASTVANSMNILFARSGAPPLRPTPQQPGQPQDARNPQQQVPASQSNFAIEQEAKEEGYYPWLGGQAEPNSRGPDGRSTVRPVSDLVGRVRVVPDPRSNALLISANVHFFPQVIKLVEELDAPTAQVLIEARIVEVSSDYLDKLGVRWSPDGSQTFTADDFDNAFVAKASSRYTKGFGGKSDVNLVDSKGIASSLASLRSGVLDSSISMDFLVQFLRKTTDATVLAEPQINIADNELGKLFVGQQIPFIDRSLTTDVGALNSSFSYKDVGIILEVTPHINTAGDVALKIRVESSSLVPGQTLFGGALLDTRNFRTDITAKNGQTLVLGGIIQKQVADTLRKTPILGSIPGLGWAFKKKDRTQREVELMVFLRPKVVRTPDEAKELLEEVDKKAPLLKKYKSDAPGSEAPPRKGQ